MVLLVPALLVIDVQRAHVIDRDAGYPWGAPDADQQIAALIAGYRAAGQEVTT